MDKVLVAYFSATGVTANQAKIIAESTGGDLFEIRPEVPYTSGDLNWQDKQSRSTVEQNDDASRPAIAELPRLSGYDTVFLGFPIWWYTAPKIMWTFVEGVDLAGKNVVTFATSGSSPIGNSTADLSALTGDDVNWIEGRTLNGAAASEISDWIDSLGI